jgi:hypothetical protein
MEQIDEEALAMINAFGVDAYSEARRREDEASSDAIAKDWGQIALSVARKMSQRIDVDPSTKVAMNAVLVGFPIPNAGLLLGFQRNKDGSARRNIEPLQ